jgi:two-component system, response regulator, stage 0 sporulation protein F
MTDIDRDQLNVLVIDDDPDVRRLLTEIVLRKEHQAIAVASAEEGLELLPSWTFQVAFIDQHLPGMEGLLLGEYLRRNNPHMMIAIVTGQPDRQLERRSKAMAIRVIAKPFNVQQIFSILDEFETEVRCRQERRECRGDDDFAPPFSRYAEEITAAYDVPGVPGRIEERLVQSIKRCLSDLRSVSRYSERDRVVALSGLLAARVLGLSLPRGQSGLTLEEEYDELMLSRGRRTEFSERRTSVPPPPRPSEPPES